jgi:ABC-2 type transport system ATP-binding protein
MLWENVRKLNADGMTIILTTHYLEEAEEMCDEIAIINHGSLIVRDSTKALLGRMDAKTLVIHSEGDMPDALAMPDGVTIDRRADGAVAFTYRRSETAPDAILDALRQAGVRLRDVASEEPDLEDVFLDLTRKRAEA